ncbi:fasciclin domain-containing protein [Dictyobacter kobayashii]|uniref:FAS1 domain-containing protein n=1 Tax=Dictyobacter kobayashii TaxID=2014872 RepID=A0A402AYY0_9CHLR|nr:fasciclin domain-containing protein [Dictyobacter kobayashii]GCE24283.1 hypothetical protein KDK_80830 [Dictyobacter kobayashii]
MEDIDDILLSRKTAFTFNVLHTLLDASGRDVELQNYADSFTVFAPPDEAFGRLKVKTPFDLMQDIDKLNLLLTFHMVPLKLMQADLLQLLREQAAVGVTGTGRESRPTLELGTISGHPLHVRMLEHLMVEHARVLQADVTTDNGVVHIINRILWPPGLSEESFHGNVPFHTAV